MSIKQDRDQLKTYFETGDRPTEEEFCELIDSGINQKDDEVHIGTNKNVGLGIEDPKEKLHVDGTIRVVGHIHGDDDVKSGDQDLMIVSNNSQIQLHGNQHTGKPGAIVIGADKTPGQTDSGEILFSQRNTDGSGWENNVKINHEGKVEIGKRLSLYDGKDANNVSLISYNSYYDQTDQTLKRSTNGGASILAFKDGNVGIDVATSGPANSPITDLRKSIHIKNDGNIGIGTDAPVNKLHIESEVTDPNLGLKLSDGVSNTDTHVLVSDAHGNASWTPPTTITNGLWKKAGTNNIENGNGGNVGIGTNTPDEKLHVNGNTKIDTQYGHLLINNDSNGASVHVEQRRNVGTNAGNIRYHQVWGDASNEKIGAFMHTSTSTGPNGISAAMGAQNGSLYLKSGPSESIMFFPGETNWNSPGGWADKDGNWFLNGHTTIGNHFHSGPNKPASDFGLEVFADSNNKGLQVNGNTNFNGNITVDNQLPFFIKKCENPNPASGGALGDVYIRTHVRTSDYAAACIVSFHASGSEGFLHIVPQKQTFSGHQEWIIKVKMASVFSGATLALNVLFIKTQLINSI